MLGFLIFVSIGVGMFVFLPLFGTVKLWKKGRFTKYGLSLLWIGYVYSWWRAFYPEDEFFVQHLEQIAQIEFDEHIRVLYKSAGYPDIHGDYPACATFEISAEDATKLLKSNLQANASSAYPGFQTECENALKESFPNGELVSFSLDKSNEVSHWGYVKGARGVFFDYYSH